VHAVAESILYSRSGLLQRTTVHCQESAWRHIDPSDISLIVVLQCFKGHEPHSVAVSQLAHFLEICIGVELVK
jgi:hypothetical protein